MWLGLLHPAMCALFCIVLKHASIGPEKIHTMRKEQET